MKEQCNREADLLCYCFGSKALPKLHRYVQTSKSSCLSARDNVPVQFWIRDKFVPNKPPVYAVASDPEYYLFLLQNLAQGQFKHS